MHVGPKDAIGELFPAGRCRELKGGTTTWLEGWACSVAQTLTEPANPFLRGREEGIIASSPQ